MRRFWKHYNLSIVLTLLMLVSWGLQTWMGWRHFASAQQAQGEAVQVFGPAGYVWSWGEATFENWQSEFLQLLTFVVLTTYLVHRGSHESRDADEVRQASLDRVEARLMRLETKLANIDDDDLDALIMKRIERLKIHDAVRDQMPPPVPRTWYPASLQREENEAEAGQPPLH